MTSIRTHQLCKSFGGLAAINDIDLYIQSGERHAIIGPNGSGKTTLLRTINGELESTKGSVFLGSEEITNLPIHSRAKLGLGCTFQHNNSFSNMTTIENISIAIQHRLGIASNLFHNHYTLTEIMSESQHLLYKVGLDMVEDKIVDNLSYGQQRVLDVAISLAMKPKVLLLDEPTAGMSILETTNMLKLIGQLQDTMTLVLVEHDMDVVFKLATRITVLHNGKIISKGTPYEIRKDSKVLDYYLGNN